MALQILSSLLGVMRRLHEDAGIDKRRLNENYFPMGEDVLLVIKSTKTGLTKSARLPYRVAKLTAIAKMKDKRYIYCHFYIKKLTR